MDISTFIKIFIELFVTALFLVVAARVLIGWINPKFEGPVARFLFDTTEPLLAPIRRVLPKSAMLDWSPVILAAVLLALMRVLLIR